MSQGSDDKGNPLKVDPIQAQDEKKEISLEEKRALEAAEQDKLAKKPADNAPQEPDEELVCVNAFFFVLFINNKIKNLNFGHFRYFNILE